MKNYAYAVIGAGPAGIVVVGKLLDEGIPANQIAWIDPYFQAGDFGRIWSNVSSNTKVELFLKFFHACTAFHYQDNQENFPLGSLHPDQTCELYYAAEPLQWITEHLRKQVTSYQATAKLIKPISGFWEINLSSETLYAKKVVLALGADPDTLPLQNIEKIALEDALDVTRLEKMCGEQDVIAVFGSSHSAITAIWNLLDGPVQKVINFYRSPLRYAIYMNDWILFDDSGLKGKAADWAKQHIDAKQHEKLERYQATEANLEKYLPECNKAIVAVGFKPRQSLTVEGVDLEEYDTHTGIIAPNLYGVGIAFPEEQVDKLGNVEYRVGLWKFMDFLTRVIPQWIDA